MEKVKKSDIITALSIHSSRVSACISAPGEDGDPHIAGLGKSEGKLLGEKGVLSIDRLSGVIREALARAREEAKTEPRKVLVCVSGGNINSEKSRGIVKLSQRGEEISERNIKDALKIANTIPINMEKEIIHSIPQSFILDGQKGIEDPVGLFGVKLELEALLVTAHLPFLQNIVKAVNLAGLDLEDVAFSGIASSKCLLSGDTEKKGIILMEIDNHYTACSLFFGNVLRGVAVEEKSAIKEGALEALRGKLDKMRGDKTISRIFLTGGGYIHEDFIEKVNTIFGIPSEMAYVRNVKGSARDIRNTFHLTSMGLALYGLERRRESSAGKRRGSRIIRKISKSIGDFINEYF